MPEDRSGGRKFLSSQGIAWPEAKDSGLVSRNYMSIISFDGKFPESVAN